MKIGAAAPGAPIASGGVRRAEAAGFEPPMGTARAAGAGARAGAAGPVAGLEALLMLQEEGGPTERRRRAVRRAGSLLDGLDALRMSLMGGDGASDVLAALQTAVREQRGSTEDRGLDEVLDAIDTRAAVEIAKQEMAASREGRRQ